MIYRIVCILRIQKHVWWIYIFKNKRNERKGVDVKGINWFI